MHDNNSLSHQFLFGILCCCILWAVYLIYTPGSIGVFLLDDIPNLQTLSRVDIASNWQSAVRFAAEGNAGTLGRPISLLTFAAQAEYWPTNPKPFKQLNIAIHILNGCLIFWLLILSLKTQKQSELLTYSIALIASTIWLIHPIQVSGVLYVIQRMNELTVLFTLTGLIFYVKGRIREQENHINSAFILQSIGIGLFGLLAVFSKENGILLPLFALVIEYTLLNQFRRSTLWKKWAALFLWAPLVILFLYFATDFDAKIIHGYIHRDFSLEERLLTESRVLLNYLSKIVLILPHEYGLYHDDFLISSGLMTPISTLLATTIIAVLIGTAFYTRTRFPVYAFAVFWFFGGHLLESTFIPLEIYFDHRNYLPMLGPALLLSHLVISGVLMAKRQRLKIATGFLAFSWIGFTAWATAQEAQLWGNPILQSAAWAKENPNSIRAQIHLLSTASILKNHGYMEKIGNTLLTQHPLDSTIIFISLHQQCRHPEVNIISMDEAIRRMPVVKPNSSTPHSAGQFFSAAKRDKCLRYSTAQFQDLLAGLISNDAFTKSQSDFYYLRAQLHYLNDNGWQAIEDLEQAYQIKPAIDPALQMVILNLDANRPLVAKDYITKAIKLSEASTKLKLIHGEAIEELRRKVDQALALKTPH